MRAHRPHTCLHTLAMHLPPSATSKPALQCALHHHGELVPADIPWQPRDVPQPHWTLRKNRKAMPCEPRPTVDVGRLTGLRRSAIYEQMRRGIFPRSVKTGQRTAAWPESAVQSWIAERMNGRAT